MATRSVRALRPLTNSPSTRALPTSFRRPYHSSEDAPPQAYPPHESAILSSALSKVPEHGFSPAALRAGLREQGYLDASSALFPRGEFEIVLYHLRTQRLGLVDRVQFPSEELASGKGVGRRVRSLVLARLEGNVQAKVVGRWTEALGLMSLAGNIPASTKELGLLSDEIWYLAGDKSVDGSWYSKRATLSGVYAATELFQTTDQSTDYKDTGAFLDRRLEEVRVLGSAVRNVSEWAGFQGVAAVNLARSLGVRI